MSELKLISPLLDNYDIGSLISSHNGVQCYPAMMKDTTDRYIIKNISVPESQARLEALLLTGAYPDADSALSYFHAVADGIVEELDILKKLSEHKEFTSYDEWQLALKDGSFGYDVCMVGTYKYTLRKYLQHNPITHLTAINLGLDLCQALISARREGYLYIDLKPNNIFVDGQNFQIGDLGFLRLDSLQYASIPDKYCSAYTAPEALDAFTTLSPTLDIYALGLILYQAYNGGELPKSGSNSTNDKFDPPAFADYEMSDIILKACDPNPEERWQDPAEMKQALISYMQRNGANDTPIVPPVVKLPEEIIQEYAEEEETPNHEVDTTAKEDVSNNDSLIFESDNEELDGEDLDHHDSISDLTEANDTTEEQDDILDDLAFIDELPSDDTTPENNLTEVSYDEVSDELSDILAQADELVAEPIPDPPVAPEGKSIDEIIQEEITEIDEEAITNEDISSEESSGDEDVEISTEEKPEINDESSDSINSVDSTTDSDNTDDEIIEEMDPAGKNQKRKKVINWILSIIIFLLIAAIAAVAFFYYKNIYLLPIDDIKVDGNESSMVVHVDTDIDEAILSVVCSDSHGNQISAPVVNGTATFANLTPDTAYTVRILVDGFHRLTGETAASYSTPAQTNIIQLSAVTGSEDGSVILNFDVDGPDTGVWKVSYATDGEEEKIVDVLSHMVTLNGLTVGKEYMFTLIPGDGMYVSGVTQIPFTASELVYAKDVTITGCIDGKLTATWAVPEGIEVPSWTVRCYDGNEYNQTAITSETTVTFENVDSSRSYTIEVIAAGMSVSERAFMAENAITITDFTVDSSVPNILTLNWNTNQAVPAEGFVVLYSVDGSDTQNSVTCVENTVQITPVVPGATYQFKIQQANGTAVLSGSMQYEVPAAQDFSGYGMTRGTMSFQLCKRPDGDSWKWSDLSDTDMTSSFALGQKISILGQLHGKYGVSNDPITAVFVIRDAEDNLICHSSETRAWSDMWELSYGEIDIPQIPSEPGAYTVTIYFNGLYVTQKSFTIE